MTRMYGMNNRVQDAVVAAADAMLAGYKQVCWGACMCGCWGAQTLCTGGENSGVE